MLTIADINKENSEILYWLEESTPCKISINGKVIFEGLIDNYTEPDNIDNTITVCEFETEDKHLLTLIESNVFIKELKELFENKEFETIYSDSKLFNKAMLMANHLPLYNITNESNTSPENLKAIKKYGTNFQKIYENYYIS